MDATRTHTPHKGRGDALICNARLRLTPIPSEGWAPSNWSSLFCYLKLTDACQTKARSKKSTGIIGNTSTIGSKGAYASGNFASKKAINNKSILYEVEQASPPNALVPRNLGMAITGVVIVFNI